MHDAFIQAQIAVPSSACLLGYFKALQMTYGDASKAFAPQNGKTHSKAKMLGVMRILSRQHKFPGGLIGNKDVIAQRLAKVLNSVMEAGREVPPEEEQDIEAFGLL